MDGADCQLLELLHADDPAAACIHWRARAEPLREEDAGAALAIRYLDLHFPGWRDECLAGEDPGPDGTPWPARTSRRLRISQRRSRRIASPAAAGSLVRRPASQASMRRGETGR